MKQKRCELCGIQFQTKKEDVTKCKSCRNQMELIPYEQVVSKPEDRTQGK